MDGDLISRSALKSFYCKCCNILHSEEPCEPSECNVMVALDELPVVDAVKVVRCKDCIYATAEGGDLYCDGPIGIFGTVGFNDFCSYGERRSDDG